MILRSTDIGAALRSRQRGFFTLPGGMGSSKPASGGGGSGSTATWSPTDKEAAWALSNADYTVTGTTGMSGGVDNIRATAGTGTVDNWYWEINVDNGGSGTDRSNIYHGVTTASQAITSIGSPYFLLRGDGTIFGAGGGGPALWTAVLTTGQVWKFAFRGSTGRYWMGVVGTGWFGGGDPAADTTPIYDFTTPADFKPLLQTTINSNGIVLTINCGAVSFADTPPSGFVALGAP